MLGKAKTDIPLVVQTPWSVEIKFAYVVVFKQRGGDQASPYRAMAEGY